MSGKWARVFVSNGEKKAPVPERKPAMDARLIIQKVRKVAAKVEAAQMVIRAEAVQMAEKGFALSGETKRRAPARDRTLAVPMTIPRAQKAKAKGQGKASHPEALSLRTKERQQEDRRTKRRSSASVLGSQI